MFRVIHYLFFCLQIVYIGSAKAQQVKNKIYNNGNVDIELIVKENTTFETFGNFTKCKQNEKIVKVTIAEAFAKVGQKISKEYNTYF